MDSAIKNFSTFARDCKRNLTPVLKPVLDGGDYSLSAIAKEVDRIAYRYTGDESLIDGTESDRVKKIDSVARMIEFFHAEKDRVISDASKQFETLGIDEEDVLVCIFAQIILMSIVSKNPDFLKVEESNKSKGDDE